MPGKSQLIFNSFNFGAPQQNVIKKIGYFNDNNGIFFEQDATGTLNFVIRSQVGIGESERRIPQSEWNKDRLDGTGVSGFTLDITKTQLNFIDFEWLGVGRVRCGFGIDGKNIVAHEFYNSNVLENVYMSNPNLPVRAEIRNVGTQVGSGGSLAHICSTVMSEGGYNEVGKEFSHTTPLRSVGIGSTVPIIAIRLKNLFKGHPNRGIIRLEDVQVFSVGSNVKYEVVKIRNFEGFSATGTWVDENEESIVEYNETATGITTAPFEDFMGGYAAGDSQNITKPIAISADAQSGPISKKNFLTQNYDSTNSEIFSVRVSNIGGFASNVGVSIRWREIY